MGEVLIFRICQNADIAKLSRSIRDHSTYPPFPMHCCSNTAFMRRKAMQRGCVGGSATCNLRKVQAPGRRLTRVIHEYGPLFRAIKQFPRTHGIMFLLFSIGPDIEAGIEKRKCENGTERKREREGGRKRASVGKARRTNARTSGRANGNGNFIDKIVVAVRTKRFVIVTDRSRARESAF